MARNRETRTMLHQVKSSLDSKLRIGESKHIAKMNGTMNEGIYSWNTYRSYLRHANYFAQWARNEHGCKTLEQARPYVDKYLQKLINEGKSAYTQKLTASAIAKVYGCSTKDFIKTESRHRADITRSRGEAVRDKDFSVKKNSELVNFCKCTGLRRSELESLRSEQLVPTKDGYSIHVKGKGGRERMAPIVGTPNEVKAVVDRIQNANGVVWGKVHSSADIHGYRSDYATKVYNLHARDIKDIPYDKVNKGTGRPYQSEVYHCKGDLKGTCYDKRAMLIASNALGHNRISVIAGHYLRG